MRFSSPYFVTSVKEKKMKIRERKVPDNCRVRNLNSRSLLGCNPLRFDDHLHMSPHVKVSRIPESVHCALESGISAQGIRNPSSTSQRASSPRRSGGLAVGREKEGKLTTTSLEFEFHLQFPCGSRRPSCQIPPVSAKRKRARM